MPANDLAVCQSIVNVINADLALGIQTRRLPVIRTESLAGRILLMSPYADSLTRQTRDGWTTDFDLALTHAAPLTPGSKETQIETELQVMDQITEWLIDPDNLESLPVDLKTIRRIATFDFEEADKRDLFYTQLLIELHWYGD